MDNYRYQVTAPCFYGGVYRTPNKHCVVVEEKPLTKVSLPSYLKPLDHTYDEEGNIIENEPLLDAQNSKNDTEVKASNSAAYSCALLTVGG